MEQLKNIEVVSIFTVTNYKTGKQVEEAIIGELFDGQAAIRSVRSLYPRHTKFVLEGFEINGNFTPLYIKNRNND